MPNSQKQDTFRGLLFICRSVRLYAVCYSAVIIEKGSSVKKGFFVLGVIAIITVVCWTISPRSGNPAPAFQITQLVAALGLAGFACMFVISTRHGLLDKLFNGMDKAYVAHKWLGICSVGLVITHLIILQAARARGIISNHLTELGQLGMPSLMLFVVLILVALIARSIRFEVWKTIHKFFFLPYLIGLFHYYHSSTFSPLGLSAFSVWMDILNIVGVAAAVYSIFLYERVAFGFKYQVTSAQIVAKRTLEITGKALDKPLVYKPGQFTFLKVPRGEARFSSHPFTISSAPRGDVVQLTIKGAGDHTARLMDTLKVDDEFALTKPHGMFDFTTGGNNQIWIAGGIGITPFRSFCQAGVPEGFSVDLFYSFKGDDGAYTDELKQLARENLRVHLVDSTEQGRLTVAKIQETVSAEKPFDVYFCGPKPMRNSIRENLKKSPIQVRGFHYEEFGFGR